MYGFAFLTGLWVLSMVLLWFVIAILLAVWVYKDAESRGESGVLWLIIVILTGIIGLIIWLLVRPSRRYGRGESFRGNRGLIVVAAAVILIGAVATLVYAVGLLGFGVISVPADGSYAMKTIAGYPMSFTYNPSTRQVTVVPQGNWAQVYLREDIPTDMNLVDGRHHVRFTLTRIGATSVYVKWAKRAGVSALSTVPYFTTPIPVR